MKLILVSFLFLNLTFNTIFLNRAQALEKKFNENNILNKQIAEKYCDSVGKNIFKGLDKESILKYEYFFSSIPNDSIKNKKDFLKIFKFNVKAICSYEVTKSNEKEFNSFIENYFKTRTRTPKIKVESTNPIAINPATIPVLR
tara:strand:+ start:56 stop:484 length:429 start_codon:yes stop_codon:yes gene_type:complete